MCKYVRMWVDCVRNEQNIETKQIFCCKVSLITLSSLYKHWAVLQDVGASMWVWVRLMLTAAIHQVFWFITAGACYTATVSAETQRQTWQQSRPSPGDPLTPESIRWEQCNTRLLWGSLFCAWHSGWRLTIRRRLLCTFVAYFKVKIISSFPLH